MTTDTETHDCYGGSRLSEYENLREPGHDNGHRCAYPERGSIDHIGIDSNQDATLSLTPDGSGVTLHITEGNFPLGWASCAQISGMLDERRDALDYLLTKTGNRGCTRP